MLRVLVVEPDQEAAENLQHHLFRHAFDVRTVSNGQQALAAVSEVDIVLLALEVPDLDGLELCRRLRWESDVPIIALSVHDTELDRVLGLHSGVDDYLAKPYGWRELIARVHAVLRRSIPLDEARQVIAAGPVHLNLRTREVRLRDRLVVVTRTEFDLLALLASNPSSVFSRRQIMSKVWNDDWAESSRTIDTHVSSLRRKLGDPTLIRTVRGVGFQMGCV